MRVAQHAVPPPPARATIETQWVVVAPGSMPRTRMRRVGALAVRVPTRSAAAMRVRLAGWRKH